MPRLRLPLGLLQDEWLAGRVDELIGVIPAVPGNIDVELYLVAVGVGHIQAICQARAASASTAVIASVPICAVQYMA